jgi:hypothetical protein
MISELPSRDFGQFPHDSESEDLTYKSKAVFCWFPDWLWPFMDHGENETTDILGEWSYECLL